MLRQLEKYEIEEEIGHGGMATVYRARDTVLDRLVALKVMHPHLRASEEARQRFHREAQSVARLRHPRVLEIYDFSNEGSTEAYIAAELLTGPTLKAWREAHHEVPAEIAACFGIEIAKALECAHKANIVHRDVKPENVLLHEDRTLKLTDFGIADMVDAASMTATGQILGSPGHMAPEQIEGKDTDKRTDLFSLGTVLYYLATGRLPFTGRNPHQILKRIVDGEYADPLRVNPTIGGRMRSIIVRSLARDPNDRYQTATELREDLESFIAEAGIADSSAMLERYLRDPEKVGAEVVKEAIGKLIDFGARASDAGDVPTALDYYNRVLALDDGNEKVLKLIERVGMDRRRRMVLSVGAGLMAFGAVAGGIAWAVWPEPGDGVSIGPIAALSPDAASLDAGTRDAGEALAIAAPDASSIVDAGSAVARATRDAGTARVVRTGENGGHPVAVARGPRLVRLFSAVQNMTMSVDGAAPVGFRPGTLPLEIGRHTFVLYPGEAIRAFYEPRTEIVVEVEPGQGEQVVSLAPRLKPAQLLVETPGVQARVDVVSSDGTSLAHGPANQVIVFDPPRDRGALRVRVTAAGYIRWEELRSFTAGGSTVSVTPTLVAEEEAPSPTPPIAAGP